MSFTKVTSAGIGSTELVTLDSLEVINNASIGGVLTYEDVTNVDSIGIITARAGVLVGSGITLSKDGDVFFTGIATGNGSGLTNLPAANLTGTLPAISGANLTGIDTDLVSDTSPQLGGNLDVNTKNITFGDSGGATDDRLTFGAGTDLSIYHNGSNSYVKSSTGSLWVGANNYINFAGGDDFGTYTARFLDAGAVELYHNGTKKFETNSTGAAITGNLSLSADDPTLTLIDTNNNNFAIKANTGTLYITDATSNATRASMTAGGNWTFNHNVTVTGTLSAGSAGNISLADSSGGGNNRIIFGAGDDFQLWHDGSHSYIADEGTGNLRVLTNSFTVNNAANSENMIQATQDGAVQLYHDSELHLETHANGAQVKNAGADTSLYITAADGYSAQIQLLADNGDDYADLQRMYKDQSGGKFHIQNYAGGSWENNLVCDNNGAVRLYYDNTEYASTLNTGFNVGLKARNSDYNHLTTIGWALSDGWTKVVFDNAVGANTPLTIYNSHSNFNRYMVYFRFDGGIANYQSNDTNLCDERVKKDFADVSSQWDNIKNIGLNRFRYQEDSSSEPLKIGVVAQQVETVYPDLIEDSWPQSDANSNTDEGTFYKTVKE